MVTSVKNSTFAIKPDMKWYCRFIYTTYATNHIFVRRYIV